MAERESQRGVGDRDTVAPADGGNALGALQDVRRRRAVPVGRARARVGQHAAVERCRGEHRDAALPAQRQELVGGGLVEQRVAPCDQHAVEVRFTNEAHGRCGVVDSRAHGADDALLAELDQRGHGLPDRLVQVVLRVVNVDELDPVEAEAAEAVLERPTDALAAVIAHSTESGRLREDVGAGRFAGRARDE